MAGFHRGNALGDSRSFLYFSHLKALLIPVPWPPIGCFLGLAGGVQHLAMDPLYMLPVNFFKQFEE